jgi:hypothetical protein
MITAADARPDAHPIPRTFFPRKRRIIIPLIRLGGAVILK